MLDVCSAIVFCAPLITFSCFNTSNQIKFLKHMGITPSIDIGNLIFGCWNRCSKREASLCQLENNVENLRKRRDELMAKRDDILARVRIEEARHMVQLQEVGVWRENVDAAIAEADNLISAGPQEIGKLCLGGCCSKNCVSSITFERRVVGRLQHMADLYSKDFVNVALPRPVVEDEIPGDQPVGLDTTFDKVWRCLERENIGIVGLWGMGGVGKTTLMKQIYDRFYATCKDLELKWVVVSRDCNLDKLQEKIGERLGLCNNEQWKKQNHDGKAVIIYNALLSKRFVLFLDDIWQSVYLKEVGVPTNQGESTIVFTTRSLSVCHKMRAQKTIKVEPLTPDEAWQLFRKNIQQGILDIPGILPLAEDVARECDGLPLALVIISGVVSDLRTLQEWRYALHVLRNSASEFEDVEVRVLSKLKFSFDNLPNDMARSCFLYCCLFPEDYKIEKDNLIDCLICERLIIAQQDGIHLRDKGYYDIGNLVRACLLEEVEGGQYVRMHDVVRDMALWIARGHEDAGERFFVKTGAQLIKGPSVGEWQGVKRMSLMENKIWTLEQVPMCHNLSTIFLSDNPLISMHDDFFHFMKALAVLDLSQTNLVELPSSITKLSSLHSLNLCRTRIRELPLELKRLEKLKCLNIEDTGELAIIPRNLISSLKLLQILRMNQCWYFSYRQQEGSQVLAEEVPLLEHLSVLSVTVCDAATLQQLPSCIHALELHNFRGAESLDISSFTEMRELRVFDSDSLRELNVGSVGGGEAQATRSMHTSTIAKERSFNCLRDARFFACPHLPHLTWLILSPNLRKLQVIHCESMTEIISAGNLREIPEADGNRNLFGKLEFLDLVGLPNLKGIYWEALPFPSLKEIKVSGCPSLKRLPLNSNSAKDSKLVIGGGKSWWNDVEWEDEATKSTFLPCFKTWQLL